MTFDPQLQGKVAIITGAAGGFGQVLVRAFVDAGAAVAALDMNEAGLAELEGERCLPILIDIADPNACQRAVTNTAARFGGVHILINNAAVGMGMIRDDHMTKLVKLHEITPQVWRRFVDVNFSGAFFMTRAVAPRFLEQGWGRIINVTTSFFTMLRGGFAPYGPVKAGLEALSAGHAKEFDGSGVTVNVVVPGGPSDTPMVPEAAGFDRAALVPPQAMAPPMLWLCSPAGDAVTGRRFVAAQWDTALAPQTAAERCAAPIGWPELAQSPVWPGGKPERD